MKKIPKLSLEFFPTSGAENAEKLAKVRQDLSALNWEYYSVTYGAGGSTRERTMNTVEALLRENKTVMPHLTCVASSRAELSALLQKYRSLGINHLMALRGDMPSGTMDIGELESASDLVRLTRELWGEKAKIHVAAYPEMHPRSRSPKSDLLFFCEKMRSGADEAVTQYFFNIDAYLRFRDEVWKEGIEAQIIPGIMPITNFAQLARFSDACGAEIPRWLRKRLEEMQDDLPALLDFGADVIAKMCEHLQNEGVESFHFYSMNRSDAILAIAKRLSWL